MVVRNEAIVEQIRATHFCVAALMDYRSGGASPSKRPFSA